ncbi:unnamed protein product, partial [marine sediment metagenome]
LEVQTLFLVAIYLIKVYAKVKLKIIPKSNF